MEASFGRSEGAAFKGVPGGRRMLAVKPLKKRGRPKGPKNTASWMQKPAAEGPGASRRILLGFLEDGIGAQKNMA